MFCHPLFCSRACLLSVLVLLMSTSAFAQKVVDNQVWTTFRKTPRVALAPAYQSYSVVYELNNLTTAVPELPHVQNLEIKKSDADLTLRIFMAPPLMEEKHLHKEEDYSDKSRATYRYDIAFAGASRGYLLVDERSNKSVAGYTEERGVVHTPSFDSEGALNFYMATHSIVKPLLDAVIKRTTFELSGNSWAVRLKINRVQGNRSSYQEINGASDDFISIAKQETPDVQKLRPLALVWEKYLAQVDWEDNKAELNKKVGLALLENLCAAYFLLEDHPAAKGKAALYESQNTSAWVKQPPLFYVEKSYPGPTSASSSMLMKDSKLSVYNVVYYRSILGGCY